MKDRNCFFITVLLTLFAFVSVTYTACKKDPCEVYTCRNSGTCADGKCVCPTGYEGVQCEKRTSTQIVFRNRAMAAVQVTDENTDSTKQAAAGDLITFWGVPGQSHVFMVYAAGQYYNGTQVGISIYWNFGADYPSSGSTIQTIDVPQQYYYLQVVNSSTTSITSESVNGYAYSFNIPTGSNPAGLGYYSTSSSIVQLAGPGKTWNFNLSYPYTVNQVITVTAN